MLNYFEPQKFEQRHGRSLYEWLGVRFFKRHLLPTDLLLYRLRGRPQMRTTRDGLGAELRRLDWATRRNEVIHLLAMALIGFLVGTRWSDLNARQITAIFLINLYANIYPIFVQRYNRYRLQQLRQRP